jgi:RNase P subunit RPR2
MLAWNEQPLKNDVVRLSCPKCHNTQLMVDYGPLLRNKGKREKGLFGTCAICGFANRLSAGRPK